MVINAVRNASTQINIDLQWLDNQKSINIEGLLDSSITPCSSTKTLYENMIYQSRNYHAQYQCLILIGPKIKTDL